MKKLAKISLLGDVNLLSKNELKQLVGSSSTCSGKTQSQCSGSWKSGNLSGSCSWTKTSNSCMCATVEVGPFYGSYIIYED